MRLCVTLHDWDILNTLQSLPNLRCTIQNGKINKDREKANNKAWRKKRLREDPSYKIQIYLRSRIGKVLKNQKAKKYYHFNEVIGCSPKELKDYLERKFRRGMSWENYSRKTWHIDHIKACSKFDLTKEEEQRKCFQNKG